MHVHFSWFSEEDPDRMRAVVEFATNLPCLMALTTEEIRGRLEEIHLTLPTTRTQR